MKKMCFFSLEDMMEALKKLTADVPVREVCNG